MTRWQAGFSPTVRWSTALSNSPGRGRDLLDLERCVRLRDLLAAWLVTGLKVSPGDACLILGLGPIDAEVFRRRLAGLPRDPGVVLRDMRKEIFTA